uniref:RNA methyltransferase n=1 Tax=Kalanchoe fedtschenkoi TaxID=63787 RepID=A0A7N0V0H8_KALFE
MGTSENPKVDEDGEPVKYKQNKGTGKEKFKAQQDGEKRKRKGKEHAPFGNYRNYYGYRLGQGFEEDPRLQVFRKEWFQDKDCLDIGCNSGLITIHIAKKFQCKSMIGIDIDNDRIQDAYWTLRKIGKMESSEQSHTSPDGEGQVLKSHSSSKRDLSEIVSFWKENFVQNWDPHPGKFYDTVICLSVTKWIHLNWGDDGLITLFSKIWRLLQPGGILVLEPQPWTSYEKNRKVSEATATISRSIMFYPNIFQELLLDKIGFRTVEDLTSNLSGPKTGFNRPMLAFRK